MTEGETKYLRLVESDVGATKPVEFVEGQEFKTQTSLFSDASRVTLGFIVLANMPDDTFQHLLSEVRPRYILDMRLVPSFSSGALTRRTVFTLFEAYGIQYFDVAGALDISGPRDASSNPKLLIPKILQILLRKKSLIGPVLFFVDKELLRKDFIDGVEAALPHDDGRGWEISIWDEQPPKLDDLIDRKTIFISHANPQDNDVARWLGVRLAAEGYEVWSDITKLIGGETFWDTIESIIREKAACVVVLLSRDGHEKPGVLDEVNIAISTERRLNASNFVIPIRIDDLPFGEIRANLARKNIIDGSRDLNFAFQSLIATLEEMRVLREKGFAADRLRAWRRASDISGREIRTRSKTLIQNSLEIAQWPDQIRKVRGLSTLPEFRTGVVDSFIATAPIPGGQLCFGGSNEILSSLQSVSRNSLGASCIFSYGLTSEVVEILDLSWADARRALSQIVRRAWDERCSRSGLRSYELASGHYCWFEPLNSEEGNEVQFLDVDEKRKRRSLVGRSEKRGVYWHFAVEGVVDHMSQALRLRSHVVFSEDGINPIAAPAKQHSLRRGFCRNWWNDRWRTLLQAFVYRLANGKEEFGLPVSPFQEIRVTTSLKTVEVTDGPVGLTYFDEPKLEFGFNQESEDPREGLMLFGPTDFERNPKVMRIGVVGAPEGIELFTKWCKKFKARTDSGTDEENNRLVPFPGFDATFGSEWPEAPVAARAIPRTDLLNAIRITERHQAVAKAVGLFVDEIYKASHNDDVDVDIWFVVVPEELFVLGRPNSRVPKEMARKPDSVFTKRIASRFSKETPSLFEQDNEIARIFDYHADFHHQLKNRLLELREVTQIFRESSIIPSLNDNAPEEDEPFNDDDTVEGGKRRMQGPLDVNWNIGTTCFFKAGGRPWKVTTARPGVCYVGLIFKQDLRKGGNNHCCGAQLFLESGEGIVFKGALGPWYSKDNKQFHLSKSEAKRLIEMALGAYLDEHDIYPAELFIHGRTRFNKDELEGFHEAAPHGTDITGVRITRTSEVKLFTAGDLPVNRGTALLISRRLGYIWTSGYVDHLKTYQGRETPNPLRVEICGDTNSDLKTVLRDVMTLTKMNFNSSVFADGFPVSMRFADAIGNVLMATQDREIPPLPFRHYI